MANPSLVYPGRIYICKPSLGGKEWTPCLQQGQATLGYHSGREQCQYTLGWKPFVPPDVLTYFYSLSSSHRPSLPTSIPIPQNTNTNKRTNTNTAKRPDLFLRLSFSSHHMCSARWQTEGVFLSINKFKNNCKMANVFIHNLGSPVGKGWDIDDVWMFDLSREDLFSEWGIILAFIMAETFKVRIRNGSETESRINCAHWFGFSTIILDWVQLSMLGCTYKVSESFQKTCC